MSEQYLDWRTVHIGTLYEMLKIRHDHMRRYIRENTDLFNVTVVC